MNVFDIIGPVMVGPSSSHTAGAARIGRIAGKLFGAKIDTVLLQFFGSFADTYKGHGTDRAIVGGLLGFAPDDARIKNSLELAKEAGLRVEIEKVELRDSHPNTAVITMRNAASGQSLSVAGSSIGGGNIVITRIGDLAVEIKGEYHTLAILHRDVSGMVAKVTSLLAQNGINLARMFLSRSRRGGEALMIIETDEKPGQATIQNLVELDGILNVRYIEPV